MVRPLITGLWISILEGQEGALIPAGGPVCKAAPEGAEGLGMLVNRAPPPP